ncbi:MAG: hypothetical protein WCD18_00240 [Thermosynechococcaceae cyanobacterium]
MLTRTVKIWLSLGAIGSLILIGLTANAAYRQVKSQIGWVKPVDLGLKAYAFGRCYPSTYQRPMDIKTVQDGNIAYWEVQALPLDPAKPGAETLHFQTEDYKCAWLNRNRAAVRLQYLSEPVAVALSRQEFERMLGRCKEVNAQQKDPMAFCLKDLPRALGGTPEQPEVFYAEDVQALRDIGVDTKKIANVRFVRSNPDIP